MESTLVSGGQQEVFPFAYLQSALTHMFEEPKHMASFVQPCALMLALFNGVPGNTQGQILRAAVLNTRVIQVNSQESNTLLFKKQYPWQKDLCLLSSKSGTNGLSAQYPVCTEKYHQGIDGQRDTGVCHGARPELGDVHFVDIHFVPHLGDYCSSPERCQEEKSHVKERCAGCNAPILGRDDPKHLALSQQLRRRQVIAAGGPTSSSLTLLYLPLVSKLPSMKGPSLMEGPSLRLFCQISDPSLIKTLGSLFK